DEEDTLTTAIEDLSSLILYDNCNNNSNTIDIPLFQEQMEDPLNGRISKCQNTYFMDGGVRFISLPTLGNSNTKVTSPISRLFEEWLANKLYSHPNDTQLPILEDNIELLVEDILNKFKSRVRTLKGLSNILIKIRTGHVYTYHQLEDGQPLITEDMEDFFQQFPLFVEIIMYVLPTQRLHYHHHIEQENIQLLLVFENSTLNPGNPYTIMESI
ncbi:hypothetical protein BDB01DRAFT_702146, partial [Pilobolus umbonatus]